MEYNHQSPEQRRQTSPSKMHTPARLPSERPISPPPLRLARPPISSRNSVTSVKRMPVIREDDSHIFTNLENRRSRPPRTSVFYQYGEDYITPWHLVGISPSPTPRGPSSSSSSSSRQGCGVPRTSGASSSEDLSDGEHDEKHGKRDGGSSSSSTWAARRGALRRLCESRYLSWL
ncbi:hypothetical protein VPNG_09046 [Cytospora leucostoma]|uniref:Uncharacterized protein n=1 Tax=Cytospora leucostoma TaxID=1230097 RepID=A0A423VZ78_9PEZI|nr:hypothetical protein VPNG_09046 [Cytospora leucostoma]